jgi:isopenicillin N synthase-like dioxygenase
MTTSFEAIPSIDLSLANNPSTLSQLLKDLRHALIDVGFLYISNHGVPSSVITDLVSALPGLFSLDEDAKRAVALENSPHFLGYSGVGSETTGGSVDLREQFEFATELTATWREGAGLPLYERLRGPNQVGWASPFVSITCEA